MLFNIQNKIWPINHFVSYVQLRTKKLIYSKCRDEEVNYEKDVVKLRVRAAKRKSLFIKMRSNRHALLNTRNLPVYLTCRLCQQTQTLNLLVVVQGQFTMGCAADESGMEGGFSEP
jgi:hypothetical protein